MQQYPKLQEMLSTALIQVAQECGTLLGQELGFGEDAVREVTKESYFKSMENASFVAGIESNGEYQGSFFVVISIRDAIALSGTLLGVPPARITEKKRLAILEPDDVDAFSEIANQMTGSFNTVFKSTLPRTVHLKQLVPKQYIPGTQNNEAETQLTDGEYFLLQSQLTLAGSKLEKIEILIPVILAKLFDQQEIDPDVGVKDDEVSVASAESQDGGTPAVLILDDDENERKEFQEILKASGISQYSTTLDADLNSLLTRNGLKAVLLGVSNANSQELSTCLKITSITKGCKIPIIMCGREWTRTSVLKALRNGAGDILLKPCSADDLYSRLNKYVNAP